MTNLGRDTWSHVQLIFVALISVVSSSDSLCLRTAGELGTDGYDPFAERNKPNATNDWETFAHLLISALGTGILSMPVAFMYTGLIMGVLATIFTAVIITHCAYLLVKCAHALYYRNHSSTMTYAEVVVSAFAGGPAWCQPLGPCAEIFVNVNLFITYFGTCSVYAIFVAKNIQVLLPVRLNVHILIALLFLPFLLLTYIPNLKLLAPVSIVANIFMLIGLAITFCYCVQGLPHIGERDYFHFLELPPFFSICIFAMEAIGMVMPLENHMKTPRHFITPFGVLNCSMFVVIIIYSMVGFAGYWHYGSETAEIITLNLPDATIPSMIVQVMASVAVFCSYGVQFVVVLETVWLPLEKYFPHKPMLGNYICRTALVVTSIALALVVPTVAPFMGLIGALSFSMLGLLIPAVLELLVFYDNGFGFCLWMWIKNIFIIVFAIFSAIFGTYAAIRDISKLYID